MPSNVTRRRFLYTHSVALLATGISCTLNESMDETYIPAVGAAVRKVAQRFTI